MQRPISLKVYSIALALLALMIVVAGLSARNLRSLNNEIKALSEYYIPLDQQMGSVETLIRQQTVHLERILLLQRLGGSDKAAFEDEKKLFDDRGVNADQVIDSSLRLLQQGLTSDRVQVDRPTFDFLQKALPGIQTARQNFHATFRKFLTEAEEGNPRSIKILREIVVREKEDLNGRLEKVILSLQGVTQTSAKNAQIEEQRAFWLNWGITSIAGILGLVFAAIITRGLVQPVHRLLSGTRAVEQGDLTIQINASSTDEIAALTQSFNTMVAGLREKERIQSTFSQYVDPRVVKGLLENQATTLSGERRVMTVFFSDLEGFTQICEQMTPTGVVRFLNQYFTLMSESIRDNKGILDKFIGDGIMAFWGPPFTEENEHAKLACLSALEQMGRLETFRRMLPDLMGLRRGLPTVNMRIGIATGDVTVGSIGSESSKGFTVMGDIVNTSSRLEGANKEYGSSILISEDTWNMAADAIEVRELDYIRVVGKNEPVRIFELLGRKGGLDAAMQELRNVFAQGLQHYRQHEWEPAEAAFEACLKLKPDDAPSKTLLSRTRHFRDHPADLRADGVWNLRKK